MQIPKHAMPRRRGGGGRRLVAALFIVVLIAGAAYAVIEHPWSNEPGPSPKASGSNSPRPTVNVKHPIKHIVFLIKENRSFDEYFGKYPGADGTTTGKILRSEEHTSELQSRPHLVCRLLLEKKKTK